MSVKRGARLAAALIGVLVISAPVAAQPIVVAPDVTVDLAAAIVPDEQAVLDDGVGPITPVALGALPVESSLSAYARAGNGDTLFSLEATLDLGAVVARCGDVVRFDGATHSLAFDAAAAGVPHGACIDAIAVDDTDLLLSFDVTVALPAASSWPTRTSCVSTARVFR